VGAPDVNGRRVVVAMSGGVDSSVAATLLVEQGHEVIGLMARLWAGGAAMEPGQGENRCCTSQAEDDARRLADLLCIPFYLVNMEAAFKTCVVDPFVTEYCRGRTPNPCLACNRHIRFGRLLWHAMSLEASHLATGHYAIIEHDAGRYRLRRGVDAKKDQSYVLYMLGQAELERTLFPVGHLTKAEVRDIARRRGLPVADREESMEICFVADNDYRRFLREHAAELIRPGPIVDTAGNALGQHQGLAYYTVGQRRGIGIAGPEPFYVICLDAAENALVVGPAGALGRTTLAVDDVHYTMGAFEPDPQRVHVQIRSRAVPVPATWTATGERTALVEADRALRDVTPGQAAVAYRGDTVYGGGTIRE
jgi:tRNA-specific 2-thiouridylase